MSDDRDDLGDLGDALRRAIRTVPDFPTPGIQFRDLTPALADARLFRRTVRALAQPFTDAGITAVAAIESRGFLFGGPVAERLGTGLIPVRKLGRLPAATWRADYALEYGAATLELHRDAVAPGDRILVVDDVLATGGTARAAAELVARCGAQVAGFAFVVELPALAGRARLGGAPVTALVAY